MDQPDERPVEDDEEERRARAERLRRAIEEPPARPRSPREFTDRAAREAAEEEPPGAT